jgi:hypothetical protein
MLLAPVLILGAFAAWWGWFRPSCRNTIRQAPDPREPGAF